MKTTKNREESKTEEIIKRNHFCCENKLFRKKSIKKVEKHVLLFFFWTQNGIIIDGFILCLTHQLSYVCQGRIIFSIILLRISVTKKVCVYCSFNCVSKFEIKTIFLSSVIDFLAVRQIFCFAQILLFRPNFFLPPFRNYFSDSHEFFKNLAPSRKKILT